MFRRLIDYKLVFIILLYLFLYLSVVFSMDDLSQNFTVHYIVYTSELSAMYKIYDCEHEVFKLHYALNEVTTSFIFN